MSTGCQVFATSAESITKTDILDFLKKVHAFIVESHIAVVYTCVHVCYDKLSKTSQGISTSWLGVCVLLFIVSACGLPSTNDVRLSVGNNSIPTWAYHSDLTLIVIRMPLSFNVHIPLSMHAMSVYTININACLSLSVSLCIGVVIITILLTDFPSHQCAVRKSTKSAGTRIKRT